MSLAEPLLFHIASIGGRPTVSNKGYAAVAKLDPARGVPLLLVADMAFWSENPHVPLLEEAESAVKFAHKQLIDPEGPMLDMVSIVLIDCFGAFDHWDPVYNTLQPVTAPNHDARSLAAFLAATQPEGRRLVEPMIRLGANWTAGAH